MQQTLEKIEVLPSSKSWQLDSITSKKILGILSDPFFLNSRDLLSCMLDEMNMESDVQWKNDLLKYLKEWKYDEKFLEKYRVNRDQISLLIRFLGNDVEKEKNTAEVKKFLSTAGEQYYWLWLRSYPMSNVDHKINWHQMLWFSVAYIDRDNQSHGNDKVSNVSDSDTPVKVRDSICQAPAVKYTEWEPFEFINDLFIFDLESKHMIQWIPEWDFTVISETYLADHPFYPDGKAYFVEVECKQTWKKYITYSIIKC